MNVKIKQNQTPGMWYSNLENEVLEIEEQDAFKLKGHNLFILKSDCDIVSQTIESESVTVQNSQLKRKQIGTYKGVEIYEDTKAWYVDVEKLRILTVGKRTTVEWWSNDCGRYTKVYLTEKEANKRLKEEVTKAAKNRTFTCEEYKWFVDNFANPLKYAIELVEKERGVVYLNEWE